MKIKIDQLRRSLALALICAVVVATGSLIYVSAGHADSYLPYIGDFEVGDQVEASVSGLEMESAYEPCVVTEVLGNGYRLKCSGTEYVVQKAWVRRPQKAVKPAPSVAPAPAGDDDDVPAAAPAADCDTVAPGPKTDGTDRFSAAVAKRKIYDNYNIGARTGGATSPLGVGVTFLSFQLGESFRNVARGGFRINDAAPVNTTIYHVRSKHMVCEQYRDRAVRRQVESGYSCFKNRDDEWVCGIDGMPKIIQLP
jgi:hypothetical protein